MQKIALSDIKVNNPYLRTNTDIEALKKSIDAIGLINPITVNKENELLAGGRRFQAMTELGWEETEVYVVDLTSLEQELVSIDENLVRKALDKLEFEQSLNRGREIYEELFPTANKIEVAAKNKTPEERKVEKEEEENDTDSFAAITSEKTGLSKAVIKSAIKRDALSSENIKQARSQGEISATQTNEIIKLKKEEQDQILPFIQDKPVREVKKIVDNVQRSGVEAAIKLSQEIKTMPKEVAQLKALTKRMNGLLGKMALEDIHYEGPEMKGILDNLLKLRNEADDFMSRYDEEQTQSIPESHTIQ
ncbi:MAG: ParB/RepB/Spo0J family partition protein [Bacteriovoracaceae bacterium]